MPRHAQPAQPQREAEHAAERVTVGVDVTDQQDPAARGELADRRDGRGPLRVR